MMCSQGTDQINLPARWVNRILFERAVRVAGDPMNSTSRAVYFRLPVGCKIMVDAGVRLLSLINQLWHVGKRVIVDFEEGDNGTLGYLNRMGFIDLLNPEVEIRPYRPVFSGAQLFRGDNPFLVEFASISPQVRDPLLPSRLTEALVMALGQRPMHETLGNTAYTVFGELIDNIYEHSDTELDGFAVLQVYRNGGRVKVCVSDSGKGMIETLRPVLEFQRREFARLSDTDLVVEAFRSGISRHGEGRGCGLKACADQAIRFRADLEVRLPRTASHLVPATDGYRPHTAYVSVDLPLLLGTHIAFDFRLDSG
jgi:histidine kinase/DNA gyrase B/HSP90-like ATPase